MLHGNKNGSNGSNGNNAGNNNSTNNNNTSERVISLGFERVTPLCVQLYVDAWGAVRLRPVPALTDPLTGAPLRLQLDARHGVRTALARARRAAQYAQLRVFLRGALARVPAPYVRVPEARPRVRVLPTGEPYVAVPLFGDHRVVLCADEHTGELRTDTNLPVPAFVDRECAKNSDTLGTLLRHSLQCTLAKYALAAGLVPLLVDTPAFVARDGSSLPWAFAFSADRSCNVSALSIISFAGYTLSSCNLVVFSLWLDDVLSTEQTLRNGACLLGFQSRLSMLVLFFSPFFSTHLLHSSNHLVLSPQDDCKKMFAAVRAFVVARERALLRHTFSVIAAQLTLNDCQTTPGAGTATPIIVPPLTSSYVVSNAPIAFRHKNADMRLSILPGKWQVCCCCLLWFHFFLQRT